MGDKVVARDKAGGDISVKDTVEDALLHPENEKTGCKVLKL